MASVFKACACAVPARCRHKWTVRYREPGGRAGRVRQVSFPTKHLADAYAHRVEADKAAGTYLDLERGRMPFGRYAESWLTSRPRRPSTIELYRSHLRLHILPAFGAIPLVAIRREKIQAWVMGLCEKGLAPRTVRTVYGILASILRSAVLDERIARTRCVKIVLPEVEPTTVRVLSPAQVRALAAAMAPRYAITVIAGYGLGLRQGETLALSRSRIDPRHHTLRVDRQVVTHAAPGSHSTLTPPKTKAGRRTVPLPDFVREALEQHMHQFTAPGEDLLVTTSHHRLLRRSHYNQDIWRPALAKAHLPPGTTFHDLRHSYASAALAAGVPVLDLSRHLGHATTAETTETYGHLMPEAPHRQRNALDQAWNTAGETVRDVRATVKATESVRALVLTLPTTSQEPSRSPRPGGSRPENRPKDPHRYAGADHDVPIREHREAERAGGNRQEQGQRGGTSRDDRSR